MFIGGKTTYEMLEQNFRDNVFARVPFAIPHKRQYLCNYCNIQTC